MALNREEQLWALAALFVLGSSANPRAGALPAPHAGGGLKLEGPNYAIGEAGEKIAWGRRAEALHGHGFLAYVQGIADRHPNLDPGWLLSSWMAESGLNPAAHNNIGGGLFGLLWNYLPGGYSPAAWLASPAQFQAAYYEKLYGAQLNRLRSIDDVRLLGWGRMDLSGKPDETVAWRIGQPAYTANTATDRGHKGYITKGDLVAHGRALFQEGLT